MRKKLSFAVFCRLLGNLCAVVTAFVSIRLYNLYVTKEVYGAIIVGLQIISYLPLMSGGFRMSLNQQMLAEPDSGKAREIARFGQTLQSYFFIFVALAGMLLMAGYSLLPETRVMHIPLLVFVAVGLAAAVYFQAGAQLALLVAFGEQAASSLIQGLWGIVSVIILWISFLLGCGVWAFPISSGLSALVVILAVRIVLVCTNHYLPLFVWERGTDFMVRLRAVWRVAYECLYNQIATVLVFSLDLILVGVLIAPGPAAVYGIVTRIMGISRIVLQSLCEATWPHLTQEQDDDRKSAIMRKVDRLNAWIVGAWYGTLAITLLPFLGWIVKPDWLAGPLLAGLIIARNFAVSLTSPHSYGLLSAGRFRDLAKVNQQEAAIGLVLGSILSLTMGVNGTALAFLIGTLAVSGWQMTYTYFRFAHDTHWFSEWLAVVSRGLISGVVSACVAAELWRLMGEHVGTSGWLAVPTGFIAFSLPMGLVLLFWRFVGKIP